MSDDRLAYSLKEAAAKLGGISVRSVQRLVARGLLPTVRVTRRVLIPAEALQRLVAAEAAVRDNVPSAEPVAWKGVDPCYTNAQGRRSGMSTTGMQTARKLDVLLGQLTDRKPKR
jgi:excisionase family DNA binding protein